MPQTKIQGKFYPLQCEEWLSSIRQLTHAELKILYYLRAIDPYNNGITLSPAQIAKELSTQEHQIHRSTVGRALKTLDAKGFIDMRLIKVHIVVNAKGLHNHEDDGENVNDCKNVAATQQSCEDTTEVVTAQQERKLTVSLKLHD